MTVVSITEQMRRIARFRAECELDELAMRRAEHQELAAVVALRPRTGNVIPLGTRRAPINETAAEPDAPGSAA